MRHTQPKRTEITLRISVDLLEQLDQCRNALDICRNSFILRSIRRGLAHAEKHEIPATRLSDGK